MSRQDQEEGDRIGESLAVVGGNALGALLGGAGGTLIGGPAGAVVGSAGGAAAGGDLAKRLFDRIRQRRENRIRQAMSTAAHETDEQIEQGGTPDQAWLEEDETGRSVFVEVFEGALDRIQAEHQEAKIPYLSKIAVRALFDEEVSHETANYVHQLVGSLSYRQLMTIALVGQTWEAGQRFVYRADAGPNGHIVDEVRDRRNADQKAICHELMDLCRADLLSDEMIHPADRNRGNRMSKLRPAAATVYRLAALSTVPQEELEPIRRLLCEIVPGC